jgi:quinol monooxygenase YgiN
MKLQRSYKRLDETITEDRILQNTISLLEQYEDDENITEEQVLGKLQEDYSFSAEEVGIYLQEAAERLLEQYENDEDSQKLNENEHLQKSTEEMGRGWRKAKRILKKKDVPKP